VVYQRPVSVNRKQRDDARKRAMNIPHEAQVAPASVPSQPTERKCPHDVYWPIDQEVALHCQLCNPAGVSPNPAWDAAKKVEKVAEAWDANEEAKKVAKACGSRTRIAYWNN